MKIGARTKLILLLVFLTAGIIILWKPLVSILSSPEKVQSFVSSYGVLGPLIFIFLVILQVLFAPIPGQVAGIAAGYIFGTILGTVYSMIGLIIGSYIVFILSRKLGRPFVEKVVDKKTLEKFDKLIERKGFFFLFLIYLLPALPDDAVSYLAGLTKFKIRTLMIISAVGRFPGFLVLALVGSGISSPNSYLDFAILATMISVSVIVFLKHERIENLMLNIIRKVKRKL